MNRISWLFLSLLVLATAASCGKKYEKQKDIPAVPTSPGGPSSFPVIPLNELFQQFAYKPEEKCVIAGVTNIVNLSKRTRLVFYPWSFRNAAGDTIIAEEVCIHAVEAYTPADMIMNRTTGTSYKGDLLRTSGQLSFWAEMGGEKVKVAQYGVLFKRPAPSTRRMDLAYGTNLVKDSVVKWEMVDSVKPGTTSLATDVDTFYVFDSAARTAWVGAAQVFDTTTSRADIGVYITSPGLDSKNTVVYVVFPSLNSVAVAPFDKATQTFLLGGDVARQVPLGMMVHIVVVAKMADNYYYYEKKNVLTTEGLIISAAPAKQSFDFIRASLWSL